MENQNQTPTVQASLHAPSIAEVLGIGAALSQPRVMTDVAGRSGNPYVLVPKDWTVKDVSDMLPAPQRAKGNVELGDAASFIRYVNKHKDTPGDASLANRGSGSVGGDAPAPDKDDVQTVIFADVLAGRFRAVFNHHASDAPGWGDHSATYNCPISPEWKTWTEHDGRKMGQEDFAFFIEENILDIHKPVGAEMLQIVTTLKSTKNVAFDTGVRLQDGQVQLKYHEVNNTAAGEKGELKIPEEITLGMPVFVGGAAYAVQAKFRYRIEGTTLRMWYDLIRPHKVIEDAVAKVIAQVAEGTGIAPYAVAKI